MKKMLSAILALCLCLVGIFMFAACNGTPGGGFMPPPEEGENAPDEDTPTADIAVPTPNERQTVLLWNADNIPAYNESYQQSSADGDDFIPYIESYPAQGDIKGAVLICPGGAFQFRSMRSEGYDVAERLSALGYQCFVVSYRLRPYSQEVSALDLARVVRYVRSNAAAYGIDANDIAVVGFSAGGILCGELLLHSDGYLLPTFYAYGTRDPFYRQFIQNADAVREAGVPVEEHVYQNVGHGFGAGNAMCNWIPLFDAFLTNIFDN